MYVSPFPAVKLVENSPTVVPSLTSAPFQYISMVVAMFVPDSNSTELFFQYVLGLVL